MRLLLDTHVLIWWLTNDPQLSIVAREEMAHADAAFVSTASVWEISLKSGMGKLQAPDDLAEQIARHQFTVLPVHLNHAIHLREVPPLHRDPFDRMLIAQAQTEQLTIVTRDADIARYEVATLTA